MSVAARPHERRTVRRSVRRPPALAVGFALVAVAFFTLPLIGLLWHAPWGAIANDLTSDESLDAIKLSLVCSLWSTALAVVFGVPLAWVLARVDFPGRALARALVVLPMVLPPVVGGVALLYAFSLNGLLGPWFLDTLGIQFTFHTSGVVLAETFVAMPFLVITVEAGLRTMDRRYEDAAASLGANRWTVFRRVTLPMIAPSLIAGAALAWARALGEFGATITFAGNIQGVTQSVPLAVYSRLEGLGPQAAIPLSLLLLAVSIIVLVALRDRWFGGLRESHR